MKWVKCVHFYSNLSIIVMTSCVKKFCFDYKINFPWKCNHFPLDAIKTTKQAQRLKTTWYQQLIRRCFDAMCPLRMCASSGCMIELSTIHAYNLNSHTFGISEWMSLTCLFLHSAVTPSYLLCLNVEIKCRKLSEKKTSKQVSKIIRLLRELLIFHGSVSRLKMRWAKCII